MSFAPPPAWLGNTLGSVGVCQYAFLFFFLTQGGIASLLGPVGLDVLDLQLTTLFSPERHRLITRRWTHEDKLAFEAHFLIDYWIHPVVYSFFLVSLLTYITRRLGRSPLPYFLLVALPPLAGFMDILENHIHYKLLKGVYKDTDDEMIRLGSLFAIVKWIIAVPVTIWSLYHFVKLPSPDEATAAAATEKKEQ